MMFKQVLFDDFDSMLLSSLEISIIFKTEVISTHAVHWSFRTMQILDKKKKNRLKTG